ncbi:MAG TPA: lamin tail domain-containing protein, partial [Candidatus Aminicenantes bacterium]|nr:lamin tail domain-containing protein [Candidatus Aminicenantes bacterium]
MRKKRSIFFCCFWIFLPIYPLFSLTVTEVMTDPDSHPDFRLEWVELYNNSSSPLSMENWTVNGAPFSMTLEAYSCGVIVRQAEGEDSFASVYGNQNGVWGDAPGEEYPCVQASLSLVNGGGSLIIADDSGIPVLQRDYPADEGETEDNTICLYSEGIW